MKIRSIKVIVSDDATLPSYATPRSSGCDVYANEKITIEAGERLLIPTGIRMQLPEDVECQVRPRSGLAIKKGITVLNSPGTIDSDYQGDVGVIILNTSCEQCVIEKGERFAQLVFVEGVVQAAFEKVSEFTEKTERGEGGFGHTGK